MAQNQPEPPSINERSSKFKLSGDIRRILSDNILATFATTFAGLLGFSLQALVSRTLEPAQFGSAFALISFYSLVVRPAATVGRLVAWLTSRERADTEVNNGDSASLLRSTLKWLFAIGVVIALISTSVGSFEAHYFHLNFVDVVFAAASTPFLLAFQPILGALQGDRRFKSWSSLNVLLPFTYVILVLALMIPFGITGVIAAVTLGSTITFFVGIWILRDPIWHKSKIRHPLKWSNFTPFLVTGLATTLTVGVFLSADVIAVQHFFNRITAGEYSLVAVIGNAMFSVTGGVLSAMFPNIVARQARGQRTIGILAVTLTGFIFTTISGALFLQIFGATILRLVAGPRYVAGASFIGWYALGMGMVSWAAVLIHAQQARNKLSLLWVLLPTLFLRILLLLLFHKTIMMVVALSDILVFVFAIVLMVMYLTDELKIDTAKMRAARAPLPDRNSLAVDTI